MYEQLATQLSQPNSITFTKVDTERQTQIAQKYKITALPTFIVFKSGQVETRVEGARLPELLAAIRKLAEEAKSTGESGSNSMSSSGIGGSSNSNVWRGADGPRNYVDVTDQIEKKGLDLLNCDTEFGAAQTLFDPSKPSALDSAASGKGKGKGKAEDGEEHKRDWVESDTDEQLMLYIPFNSSLKVHTIHLTSFAAPSAGRDEDDKEDPERPRTIQLYTNRAHNLGFEEAEGIPPTQTIELKPEDWDQKTGTARLELRFVKFQNVTSLVIFIVSSEDAGEKVRLDRIRIFGETGEKRQMGKLEKAGEED
jgi:hypothetical protein